SRYLQQNCKATWYRSFLCQPRCARGTPIRESRGRVAEGDAQDRKGSQLTEEPHNGSSALHLLLKFTPSEQFGLPSRFLHGHPRYITHYGNQVYLFAVRPRGSALCLRKILYFVPGTK